MAENVPHSVQISSLHNADISQKIVRIFSNGQSMHQLQPAEGEHPQLFIVGGSPGVGKTTQIGQIIRKMGHDPNAFYNVSLDSIVENVKPYRIATKLIYDDLKSRRGNDPLTDKDLALLSEIYLGTITSKREMMYLTHTVHRLLDKIEQGNEKKPVKAKKKEDVYEAFPTLIDRRLEALEEGIKNGVNIIYDVTFQGRTNVVARDLMPILNKYAEMGHPKYDIHVILISSTPQRIRRQLQMRHEEMLSGPDAFIRAIPPRMIERYIEENQVGYYKIQEDARKADGHYEPSDFHFKRVANFANENNERESSPRRSVRKHRSSHSSLSHRSPRSSRSARSHHLSRSHHSFRSSHTQKRKSF
jgi:hypothetical protein